MAISIRGGLKEDEMLESVADSDFQFQWPSRLGVG